MAEINTNIPLSFDRSTIYNPVQAQAEQLALQKGRNDIQNQEFEQQLQPYKLEAANNASQLDQIKVHGAKVERALSLLQMARHPASYNAALEQAKAEGLVQPGEFPDQWNPQVPNMVFNARKSLLPMKEQLDNAYRQAILAIQQENLKMSREDRNVDRALKNRYYNILENNARTKATGQYVNPDTGEIEYTATNTKPLPASGQKRILDNIQNYRQAERAFELLSGNDYKNAKGDKNATGWKGYAPEGLLQRIDPEGVDTRAAIADLGSLIIHDRSGAAVTAAEYPRLKPFIPKETDSPKTAKKKLRRFMDIYKEVIDDTTDFYKEFGYNVPKIAIESKKTLSPENKQNTGGWSIEPVE